MRDKKETNMNKFIEEENEETCKLDMRQNYGMSNDANLNLLVSQKCNSKKKEL